MNIIKFYRVDEPFGFFSNFAPYPIFLENEFWKTAEHFFQASKFTDLNLRLKIKEIESPMKAAKEGRNPKNIIRTDWESIKESVMLNALISKFLQHPKLRKEIILTGNAKLIEHTKNDNYWADGGDGTGQNKLGELLMKVREEVKKYSDDFDLVLPPWVAFPTVSQHDFFWRMGLGEEYLTQWAKFYLQSDKNSYRLMFPESEGWEEIYD